MKTVATLALLAALPLVAACGREPDPAPVASPTADADPADAAPAPTTALGRTVARALDEARKELREGELSLNGDYDVTVNGRRIQRKADDLPKAAITPEGDLRISGTLVPMDAQGVERRPHRVVHGRLQRRLERREDHLPTATRRRRPPPASWSRCSTRRRSTRQR